MANIVLGSTGTTGFRFDKFYSYDFFEFEKYTHVSTPTSTGIRVYADSKNYTEITGTKLAYIIEDGEVMGVKAGTLTGLTQMTKGVALFKATDLSISAKALMAAGEAEDVDAVMNLFLGGNDKITGTKYADVVYGGAGNDTLIGGAGADKLYGGAGTDTASYAGATKGVVANLAKASVNTNDAKGDTYSSIENLTGSSYADILTGNTGANTINGGAGDDKLYGGLGNDLLIGGSGKDTFVFDTKLGSTNIDTIDDFIAKDDTIFLDDDIFTKAGKVGDLSGEAFYAGTKAHDATDRIIYDKTTGKLWYDADGSGKGVAIQFATLDKGLTLSASDFDIIA